MLLGRNIFSRTRNGPTVMLSSNCLNVVCYVGMQHVHAILNGTFHKRCDLVVKIVGKTTDPLSRWCKNAVLYVASQH